MITPPPDIAHTNYEEMKHKVYAEFILSFQAMAQLVHKNAKDKGWWDDGIAERNFGEMMMLATSEISEAFEAWRRHNPPSEKIPHFSHVEEELADVIIRLLDTALALDMSVPGAVVAKHEYNMRREYRHGGKKA